LSWVLKKIDTKNKLKPDLNVIAGALDGLNHYLYNFSPSESEDKKYAKNIFEYAKKALLGDTDDINRYAMPRGKSTRKNLKTVKIYPHPNLPILI
jgi:hypothetical protein